MTTTTFSYARPSDLRECYSCDLHCYERAWDAEVWARCLRDRKAVTFVVRVDGKVAGWVTGTRTGTYYDLIKLAVLPAYRRQGICKRLVEGLGSGELRVILKESNGVGLTVAKALGFKAVKVLRNKFDTEDGVLLVREGKV